MKVELAKAGVYSLGHLLSTIATVRDKTGREPSLIRILQFVYQFAKDPFDARGEPSGRTFADRMGPEPERLGDIVDSMYPEDPGEGDDDGEEAAGA